MNAILFGLYYYVTRNFQILQELGVLYVKPDSAVHNIQGRTLFDIPWRCTILSRTALKNPAVRHCYCSEKGFYKGITLSNLTLVWRFSEEQYFENTFRLFSKAKISYCIRKTKQTYTNSPQSRFWKFTLTRHEEILRIFYNTLTTISLFLPNNVAVLRVPIILFHISYHCHPNWLVFLFHSKLQLLA